MIDLTGLTSRIISESLEICIDTRPQDFRIYAEPEFSETDITDVKAVPGYAKIPEEKILDFLHILQGFKTASPLLRVHGVVGADIGNNIFWPLKYIYLFRLSEEEWLVTSRNMAPLDWQGITKETVDSDEKND